MELIRMESVDRYPLVDLEALMAQNSVKLAGRSLRDYLGKIVTHGTLVALDDDGRIRGLVGFYANDLENRRAYGSCCVVDSALRGQGWGTKLFKRMFDDSRAAGMTHLAGTVLKANAKALKLYHDFGNCRIVGDTPGDDSRYDIIFDLSNEYPA